MTIPLRILTTSHLLRMNHLDLWRQVFFFSHRNQQKEPTMSLSRFAKDEESWDEGFDDSSAKKMSGFKGKNSAHKQNYSKSLANSLALYFRTSAYLNTF